MGLSRGSGEKMNVSGISVIVIACVCVLCTCAVAVGLLQLYHLMRC